MPWAQLFKTWITLLSGQISIQVDREISFPNTYPLDNDSSNGQCYTTFEQPGPRKQITQNIKKERRKENDHPFITLRRKQIFLANKLQYLNHPIRSKLTYKLFIYCSQEDNINKKVQLLCIQMKSLIDQLQVFIRLQA